ncbi:MAG: glycosyl transferase [Pirellulaceae bacterium]
MSDFHQSGCITTIHDLNTLGVDALESMIKTSGHKTALLLPITASDMRSDSFSNIVDELSRTDYLSRVIVTLGVAPDANDYAETIQRLHPIRQRVDVVWADSPSVLSFFDSIAEDYPAALLAGKGRSVWAAIGYILADNDIDSIVLHDCDIVTYDRMMAARLVAPITHEESNFQFVKAYYARTTTKMHGRVVRLLVAPLLKTISKLTHHPELLQFLTSFRYPLAGEFGMSTELAWKLPISANWGLEITSLSKVFQMTSSKQVCQVDLATSYDHKHQDISSDDSSRGLNRMAADIISATRDALAECNIDIPSAHDLVEGFKSTALRLVDNYAIDSKLNGLNYDRASESDAVDLFANRVADTWQQTTDATQGCTSILPSWDQLISQDSEILSRFSDIIRNEGG